MSEPVELTPEQLRALTISDAAAAAFQAECERPRERRVRHRNRIVWAGIVLAALGALILPAAAREPAKLVCDLIAYALAARWCAEWVGRAGHE